MFSPLVQAGHMDQWTVYGMFLMHIGRLTHMPHGWTKAHSHAEPAQGECGRLCHFGTCVLTSGQHHAMSNGERWERSMCGPTFDSHLVATWNAEIVSQLSWRYTLGHTFIFDSFLVCQITSFETPISAAHVVNWRPDIFMSRRSPDLILSITPR